MLVDVFTKKNVNVEFKYVILWFLIGIALSMLPEIYKCTIQGNHFLSEAAKYEKELIYS